MTVCDPPAPPPCNVSRDAAVAPGAEIRVVGEDDDGRGAASENEEKEKGFYQSFTVRGVLLLIVWPSIHSLVHYWNSSPIFLGADVVHGLISKGSFLWSIPPSLCLARVPVAVITS